MKKIFAKYNYAFGYVKSYFVLCGLPAIGGIIAALLGLIFGKMAAGEALSLLVVGAIVLLIAVLVLLATRRKCPLANQALLPLTLNMMLAGLLASFVLAWWMFKWILKFILHINIGGNSLGNEKFSNIYYRDSDGATCHLYNACGNYAILSDENGNTIEVRFHDSDGLVCDNSGNLYRPD